MFTLQHNYTQTTTITTTTHTTTTTTTTTTTITTTTTTTFILYLTFQFFGVSEVKLDPPSNFWEIIQVEIFYRQNGLPGPSQQH